ncbi:MAG: TIGR04133 family radical SAM/SPASM protein [Bacteroidota bacterium]
MKKSSIKPSFSRKMALNLSSKYIDLQSKIHDLTYFFWECTVRCNIKCLHCGSDCHSDVLAKDMPANDFLAIAKEVSSQYNPNKVMIVITGGEPLVRSDLPYIGTELNKMGFPWGMVTNGLILTESKFQELLSAGLHSITISLDGLEDSHNWLRGNPQSFAKASDAIKMVANTKDIAYDVVTCITQKNIHQLEQIKEYLIGLGVKYWRIFAIDPIGRAKDDPMLQIDSSQLLLIMNFIAKCRKENLIQASFGCEGFLGSFEGEVRDGLFFCRAGINIASVLNDGSISACPNNSKHVVQGNIYHDSFLDVWNNKFQIMRNRSWAKEGTCANCNEFKWCKGNGLHLRDFENHDVLRCHYKMLQEATEKQ